MWGFVVGSVCLPPPSRGSRGTWSHHVNRTARRKWHDGTQQRKGNLTTSKIEYWDRVGGRGNITYTSRMGSIGAKMVQR